MLYIERIRGPPLTKYSHWLMDIITYMIAYEVNLDEIHLGGGPDTTSHSPHNHVRNLFHVF